MARPSLRLASLLIAALAALALPAASAAAKPQDVKMRTFARGATTSAVKLSVVPQAPASGATVSGTIAWAVKTAGSGVHRVDFAVDGAVKSTDSRSPFAYTGGLDTTKLGNGAHTLTATAYARGARPASATINVTVSNSKPAPKPPP